MNAPSDDPVLVWRWLPALLAAVAAIPAVIVTALGSVQEGAAFALGLLPALIVGIPPDRRHRVVLLIAAMIVGLPIALGAVVTSIPVLALVVLFFVPIIATVTADRLQRPRVSMLLILLVPPLMGIGLSLDGVTAGLHLMLLFIAGCAFTFLIALAVPPDRLPAAAADGPPPRIPGVGYGVTCGLVGVITAGVGYLLDFDHIGWACAAALLVMRPDRDVQNWRTAGRFVSVLVGAAAGAGLVELGPQPWVFAVLIWIVVCAIAATRGSRWYVLPTFTTFLVIVLLSYPDGAQAAGRFGERVGETVFGLVVAAVASGLLAVWHRNDDAGEAAAAASPGEEG
nr:FUSC family protein [Gordonia sp. NB41Y]